MGFETGGDEQAEIMHIDGTGQFCSNEQDF